MISTIILCGGKGTRLRPLTEALPKPLVPLNGSPCLKHILDRTIQKGYKHFVLCTGYRADAIVDFVKSHSFDAEIEFSDAGIDASMLERIHKARALLRGERTFITYGDTIIDVDLSGMLEEHLSSGAKITLTTAEVKSPFGLLKIDPENWVRSFEEKPSQPYYIGHMLLEMDVLDEIDSALLRLPDGQGLVTFFQQWIAKQGVRTNFYKGPKITFNTQQDLDQAEKDLSRFFTCPERGA